jgi:thioredoxin 1
MKSQWAGTVRTFDASDFREYVAREKYAVVDVYAKWCQPCKEVSAILDKLAESFGNRVLIAKMDGDENDELAEELDITAYPTVLLIEGGQVKKKIEGARSPEFYTKEIEILLGLRQREKRKNKTANGKVNLLSSETLVQYVDDSIASVIMFYKKGDYDGQLQSRAMNELAPKYRGRVLFAKAEASAERELTRLFEVKRTPELYFIVDGEVLGYADGRMTRAELRDAIEDLLTEYQQ